MWVNHSGCSYQKSDRERIAQVAHYKWATVSNLLRSLMINERISDLLKTIWLKPYFLVCFIYVFLFKKKSDSLIPSFLMSIVSESLRLLIKNEQCERIAQDALQKCATMSDLLWLLTKNERPWANRSGHTFFRKKRRDSLRKPMSEFPALLNSYHIWMKQVLSQNNMNCMSFWLYEKYIQLFSSTKTKKCLAKCIMHPLNYF